MIGGQEQTFYTVKDVSASTFIKAYAAHLRNTNKIKIPDWLTWVKTGVRQEYAPYDPDWVYVRIAALARKIYLRPNLGVGTLKHIFGGKQRTGVHPEHHRQTGGKIIRWALQELERIKVLSKDKKSATKKNSRVISKEGQRDLNQIANQVIRDAKAANAASAASAVSAAQ